MRRAAVARNTKSSTAMIVVGAFPLLRLSCIALATLWSILRHMRMMLTLSASRAYLDNPVFPGLWLSNSSPSLRAPFESPTLFSSLYVSKSMLPCALVE